LPATNDDKNIQAFNTIINIMQQGSICSALKFNAVSGILICQSQRNLVGLIFGQSPTLESIVSTLQNLSKQQHQQQQQCKSVLIIDQGNHMQGMGFRN
jgi:hypothetical protein